MKVKGKITTLQERRITVSIPIRYKFPWEKKRPISPIYVDFTKYDVDGSKYTLGQEIELEIEFA